MNKLQALLNEMIEESIREEERFLQDVVPTGNALTLLWETQDLEKELTSFQEKPERYKERFLMLFGKRLEDNYAIEGRRPFEELRGEIENDLLGLEHVELESVSNATSTTAVRERLSSKQVLPLMWSWEDFADDEEVSELENIFQFTNQRSIFDDTSLSYKDAFMKLFSAKSRSSHRELGQSILRYEINSLDFEVREHILGELQGMCVDYAPDMFDDDEEEEEATEELEALQKRPKDVEEANELIRSCAHFLGDNFPDGEGKDVQQEITQLLEDAETLAPSPAPCH